MEGFNKEAYEKVLNDTFPGLQIFVRDVNLPSVCAEKYKPGMIIKERGFTDATPRVMGMVTTHRYAILSNHMHNISMFEHGTRWALHIGQRDSHYKILDIYEYKGKTQITLLHLPDDERWKMFENTVFDIEEKIIGMTRQRFENKCCAEPIPELSTPEWLDRCAFPLGMDENGNLFDL